MSIFTEQFAEKMEAEAGMYFPSKENEPLYERTEDLIRLIKTDIFNFNKFIKLSKNIDRDAYFLLGQKVKKESKLHFKDSNTLIHPFCDNIDEFLDDFNKNFSRVCEEMKMKILKISYQDKKDFFDNNDIIVVDDIYHILVDYRSDVISYAKVISNSILYTIISKNMTNLAKNIVVNIDNIRNAEDNVLHQKQKEVLFSFGLCLEEYHLTGDNTNLSPLINFYHESYLKTCRNIYITNKE